MRQNNLGGVLSPIRIEKAFDIHVMIYGEHELVKQSLINSGFSIYEVTGSSIDVSGKACLLYSMEATNEGRVLAIYDEICAEICGLDALVEVEKTLFFASQKGVHQTGVASVESRLDLAPRSGALLEHFGDIHLDFEVNSETILLMQDYAKKGYSYLRYTDGGKEYVSITTQFSEVKDYLALAEHLVSMNQHAGGAEFRFEKLIKGQLFGDAKALPLTIGLL